MDSTDVYISDDAGQQSAHIEAFIVAVLNGSMEASYNARFGHFGPKGQFGSDLPPCAPTLLEDLEPDAGPALDATWE